MCGIIGYTGRRRAAKVLLSGLAALEYRGYDSAGVALVGKKLTVCKCGGRVSALAEMLPSSKAHTGIGHTRWATHGAPCAENAHPHLSFDGRIALVHNGVIENQEELRRELVKAGVPLASQTDSELLAHMLAAESGDMCDRLLRVAERAHGAMTVLAVVEGEDKIYCYRRGAALVIAEGNGECFAASDMTALAPYAKHVTVLRDGECAVLSPNGAELRTPCGKADRAREIDVRPVRASDCHMRDEIAEIPSSLSAAWSSFTSAFPDREEAVARLKKANRIELFGCGTAYHACLYGREVLERLTGIPCRALPSGEAEELRFSGKDTFSVFVTQSGETADTLRVLNESKKKGAYTLAVTNCEGSSAAMAADGRLFLRAGAEIAVAATKSYCSQLLALWLLAKAAEGSGGEEDSVASLIAACKSALALPLPSLRREREKLFFVGKGLDLVTAKEGALKFKEVTCRTAEAYAASELKHGPIALADAESAAVAVVTDAASAVRMRAAVSELRARGTRVFAYSSVGDVGADITYTLPGPDDCLLSPIAAVIPLQRLALATAEKLGLDPDKPRNLAKSVTVI